MFTASSTVNTAVNPLSSAASAAAASVGAPAASVSRPVSCESAMLHPKFCGGIRVKQGGPLVRLQSSSRTGIA